MMFWSCRREPRALGRRTLAPDWNIRATAAIICSPPPPFAGPTSFGRRPGSRTLCWAGLMIAAHATKCKIKIKPDVDDNNTTA